MNIAAEATDPILEMNTTPLIDVLLVLLIMFIITIPMQTHAIKIDLPGGEPEIVDRFKNKIVVDAQGGLFWNGQRTNLARLSQALETSQQLAVLPELHLQPEPLAPYVRVDEVLAVTKRAGVRNMGFVGNEQYRSF